MRRLFFLGLGLISGLLAFESRGEVDHRLSLSVVQVRGAAESGKLQFGSGVVVGRDRVVTNCHVVRAATGIAVSKGPELYPAIREQADTRHDLCLLTTPGIPFPVAGVGKSNGLRIGQPIYFYGYPNATGISFSQGTVDALHAFDGGRVIQTSSGFTLGASGGGFFDDEGQLVGLATFLAAGHAGGYYAIPAEWISELAKKASHKIEPLHGLSFWEDPKLPGFLRRPDP